VVLERVRERDDRARRILRVVKSNLGGDLLAIGFRLVGHGEVARLAWDEHLSEHDPDEELEPPDMSKLNAAKDMIRGRLKDGPMPADAVTSGIQVQGVSKRTLDRAKKELGIRSEKCGKTWNWVLPDGKPS